MVEVIQAPAANRHDSEIIKSYSKEDDDLYDNDDNNEELAIYIPNLPGLRPNTTENWVFRASMEGGFRLRRPDPNPLTKRPGTVNAISSERIKNLSSPIKTVTNDQTLPKVNTKKDPLELTGAEYDHFQSKGILRFYGYFEIMRPWDSFAPIGTPTIENKIIRPVTIYHFLLDSTTEITEQTIGNSGFKGGLFFRRGVLESDYDGSSIAPNDLSVGGILAAVGREFHIYDADKFTRDWYQNNLDITLSPAIEAPKNIREDQGAFYATGLVSTLGPGTTPQGKKSSKYEENRQIVEKTFNFMTYHGIELRYILCELDRDLPMPDRISPEALGQAKQYLMKYFMQLSLTEICNIKTPESLRDQPSLLLKRSVLEKNWKDVKKGRAPVPYTPDDYMVGNIIDVYGRQLIIISVDQATREWYRENRGLEQGNVIVKKPEKVEFVHPVPGKRDGFLMIGGDKDTLATVHGMPKAVPDLAKLQRNNGRILKCIVQLVNGKDPHFDVSRKFLLTYYLEDDSFSIYEEAKRNSGLQSGCFLKRGVYINELPPNHSEPRLFEAQDVYLGNIIAVHGMEYRIIEMDRMTLKFCEAFPDEFPLFDTFTIVKRMLSLVVDRKIDLRSILSYNASGGQGLITKDGFFLTLEHHQLCERMLDQEIMTVLRRFEGGTPGKNEVRSLYFYEELCDLMSHLYAISPEKVKTTTRPKITEGSLKIFLFDVRRKQTQWRRVFRRDRGSANGYISVERLLKQLKRHEIRLSGQIKRQLLEVYKVPTGTRGTEDVLLPSEKAKEALQGKVEGSTLASKARGSLKASASKTGMLGKSGPNATTTTTIPTTTTTIPTTTDPATTTTNIPQFDLKNSMNMSVLGDPGDITRYNYGDGDGMSVSGQSIAATVDTTDTMVTTGIGYNRLPVSPIAIRREALAESLFPRKAVTNDALIETVKKHWEELQTILDYRKLCNDIYVQDWL